MPKGRVQGGKGPPPPKYLLKVKKGKNGMPLAKFKTFSGDGWPKKLVQRKLIPHPLKKTIPDFFSLLRSKGGGVNAFFVRFFMCSQMRVVTFPN